MSGVWSSAGAWTTYQHPCSQRTGIFSIDKRHWHFERKGRLTYFSFYVYCLYGWIQRTRRKAPCSIWAVWELAWWNEQGGTGLHTQLNEKWEESKVHSQILLLLWWNMLNKWKFIFNLMFCSVATRGVLSITRGLVWKLQHGCSLPEWV